VDQIQQDRKTSISGRIWGGKKKKKRKDLEVKGFIFGDFVVFKKLNIKNEVTRIALFPV